MEFTPAAPTLIVPWPTDHHAKPLREAEVALGHPLPPLDLAVLYPPINGEPVHQRDFVGDHNACARAAQKYVKALGLPVSAVPKDYPGSAVVCRAHPKQPRPGPLATAVAAAIAQWAALECDQPSIGQPETFRRRGTGAQRLWWSLSHMQHIPRDHKPAQTPQQKATTKRLKRASE